MKPLSYYDECKQAAAAHLAGVVVGYGHAAAGVMIEAALAVAGEYLRAAHGPLIAFDTFTRAAEKAIAPQLSKIPPTPDEAADR